MVCPHFKLVIYNPSLYLKTDLCLLLEPTLQRWTLLAALFFVITVAEGFILTSPARPKMYFR